jgi:hypothetical protein
MNVRWFAPVLACLIAAPALAHEFHLGALTLHHPWARASIPGSQNGAVYLKIVNRGAADALLHADVGSAAQKVELHTMAVSNGVMKMRRVERFAVPAQGEAMLKPGGDHIMLFGLKSPLKVGDSLPMTLTFEQAGTVQVSVKVEAADAQPEVLHADH